jgi:hypothetical protein
MAMRATVVPCRANYYPQNISRRCSFINRYMDGNRAFPKPLILFCGDSTITDRFMNSHGYVKQTSARAPGADAGHDGTLA